MGTDYNFTFNKKLIKTKIFNVGTDLGCDYNKELR